MFFYFIYNYTSVMHLCYKTKDKNIVNNNKSMPIIKCYSY